VPDAVSHVRLGNSPLRRIVCQMRYPVELGFDATVVRPLQKQLATYYPQAASERAVTGIVLAPDGTPARIDVKEVFRFISEDETSIVQITDEFVALETTAYSRFEDFADRWKRIVSAVAEAIDVRKQTRLGLRYTNVIERPNVNSVSEWHGLISQHLLTSVTEVSAVGGGVSIQFEQTILIETSTGVCALRHGYPRISAANMPIPAGYVIDVDSYSEQQRDIDTREQTEILSAWNNQSYQLLRSSVTSQLWESFEPETVG